MSHRQKAQQHHSQVDKLPPIANQQVSHKQAPHIDQWSPRTDQVGPNAVKDSEIWSTGAMVTGQEVLKIVPQYQKNNASKTHSQA